MTTLRRGDENLDKGPEIPGSLEHSYRAPEPSPQQRKAPRLSATTSLPAAEMEAMTESRLHAWATHSFNGPTDLENPGDTQEMGTQEILQSHAAASMAREEIGTPRAANDTIGDEEPLTVDTNATPGTVEGKSCQVDFAQHFANSSPQASQFESQFLRDDTQVESQSQSLAKTFPQTPSMAGQKRSRNGEPRTSATTITKTPGFTQAFGGKPAVIGQSQLFGQTQADSSPVPAPPPTVPRSDDAVFSRPSPNTANAVSSSPNVLFSSPVDTRRPPHRSKDPQSEYISMEESQELRQQRMKQKRMDELQNQGGNFSDDEDNLMSISQDRRNAVRHIKRAFSDHDMFLKLAAPAKPRSRPGSARRKRQEDNIIDLDAETPATVKRRWQNLIEEDDNEEEDEEEEEHLPSTQIHPHNEREDAVIIEDEQEEDGETVLPEGSVSEDHDNDEYDELAQGLRSQSDPQQRQELAPQHNEDLRQEGVAVEDTVLEKQLRRQHSPKSDTAPPHQRRPDSTQLSTIADSQGSAARNSRTQVQYSSYVPGSQHAGNTSEDRALLRGSNQSRIPASQVNDEDAIVDQTGSKIPSSPPLGMPMDDTPDESADASVRRMELLEQFRNVNHEADDSQQEIPESEPHVSAEPYDAGDSYAPYSTARTHVSGSARSPTKPSASGSPTKAIDSQRSRLSDPSPRKINGIDLFEDVARQGALSTNGSLGNEQSQTMADINAAAGFLDEDELFMDIVSCPQQRERKRVKLTRTASSLKADMDTKGTSANSTPNKLSKRIMQDEGNESADELSLGSRADFVRSVTLVEALRDSPSKANQMPSGVSLDGEQTPDSVKQREAAGRAAMSQLIASRSSARPDKVKQIKYGHISRRVSKSKSRAIENGQDRSNEGNAKEAQQDDDEKRPVDETVSEAGDHDTGMGEASAPAADEGVSESVSNPQNGFEQGQASTPVGNRVFAFFRGNPLAYYPATWLGKSPDGELYKIRFDDETTTQIQYWHARRLELRIGDVVKVDDNKLRNKNWTVIGFGPIATSDKQRALGTDVFGHTHVKVQCRGRDSLPSASSTPAAADQVHEVLINSLYLTTSMWKHFKDREYSPPESKPATSRAETPMSARGSTTGSETPASRSRRAPAASTKTKGGRASHLRETSVASSNNVQSSGIFAGMAFAISYVSDDAEKAEVIRQIQRNGGTIVGDGFEELFDLPIIDESGAPSKSPREQNASSNVGLELQLKPKYKDLRFAALIADRHSRRVKYVQALALGLPTLSGRWILHSLDPSMNTSSEDVAPLPWGRYLLPAGESSFLGGAVRSRFLEAYDASTAQLSKLIEHRPLLLNHDGLLMVTSKKSTISSEKHRTYAFLTLALGAGQVKRVQDIEKAKQLTLDEPDTWKWVYVDSSLADAEKVMFGRSAANGKKRKRQSEGSTFEEEKLSASNGIVKIVNDEFVVQSLILGALLD